MAAKKKTEPELAPAPAAAPTATAAKKKGALSPAEVAASIIKKKMGEDPITQNLSSRAYCPSGSSAIDDLIGGTLAADGKPKCPGYPRRQITEIFGAESSGKTTAALQAIAEVQKEGGWAIFLDFEHALDHPYAKAVGVSFEPSKLLLYQPKTLEEGMKYMFLGILLGADLVIIDSVASMVPASELTKAADEAAAIGALARALSTQLPKLGIWLHKKENQNPKGTAVVFINQTRSTIQQGGGNPETHTAGGKALKFYCYLRLMFSKIRQESLEKKDRFTGKMVKVPYGNHTRVKIIKSKVDAKQGQTTDIFIRFGHGIDDYLSIIEGGVTYKIIDKSGAWYEYKGERYQGREGLRTALKNNQALFTALRKDVLSHVHAGSVVQSVEGDDYADEDGSEALNISIDKEFDEAGFDGPAVEEVIEGADLGSDDV